MRYICKFILKLWGWKVTNALPVDRKAVVIAAPHTSAWDFIIGKLAYASMGVPTTMLIKKEFFKFPLGGILRALGALSVDRGNRKSTLIQQLVAEFDSREYMYLTITPEGTRGKRDKWKRGFYEIAMAANVPIYLGVIDYGKKECDFGGRFMPTGDFEKDIKYIQREYRDITAKHPECFSWGERFYGDDK